jgi:hypothetical protein
LRSPGSCKTSRLTLCRRCRSRFPPTPE